jgi:hypothetical protein
MSITFNSYGIEIDDFKSGLMCGINKNDMGRVCFEREEILITGQSSCASLGKEYKCTWYGYSFKYKKAKVGQEISCIFTFSEPVAPRRLNSREMVKKRVNKGSFKLNKESGYFVNPQYDIYGVSPNQMEYRRTQDVICSSEGVELYKYRFISVFPPR